MIKQTHYEKMDDYSKALHLEDCIVNSIGYDGLGKALLYAMSIDDIVDNLEYIASCYDIVLYNEEEEQQ